MQVTLADEAATLALGQRIGQLCPKEQFTIHLLGDLGAGKTTFSRGLLHGSGHKGNVKSPTYTLVEHYQLSGRAVFHFDLYRLSDPEELLYLGLDDYLSGDALCLIEWPEKAKGYLPEPDISIQFTYKHSGREVRISAHSNLGKQLYKSLNIN